MLARSRSTLTHPLDELYHAASGASAAAMDRLAHLVVSARDDEGAWVRMRELKTLGPSFGPHLVAALGKEPPARDFLATLEELLHPEAFAAVKGAVKRKRK